MIGPEVPFEFAPVGVIRAAAWPIESLESFGDGNLASLALEVKTACGRAWTQYVAAYDRVLERERETLWRVTVQDSWFMKALLLSNPGLANRVRHAALTQRDARTKNIRNLDTTLYRYLARAAGRTTPYGLWSGVGLVNFTDTERNKQEAAQYFFSPDLQPFQTILRSLSRRSHYREQTCWRPNATLARQPDGAWRYWARSADGRVERREIDPNREVDLLLNAAVKLESGTFDQILSAVEALPEQEARQCDTSSFDDLRSKLDLLADESVLLGGLDLPSRFTTVWDALSAVAGRLISDDQGAWNRVVRELHCLCDDLTADLNAITLEALEEHLRRATKCVEGLAATLGVSLPELPEPLLHCDLGLPFRLDFDPTQHAALLQALQAYEYSWVRGLSPATAIRIAQSEQLGLEIGHGLGLADIEPNSAFAPVAIPQFLGERAAEYQREVSDRVAEWEQRLLEDKPEVVLELRSRPQVESSPTAPLGCLYVGLFEGFQLVIHGIGDQPASVFARHAELLGSDPLQTWLRGCLKSLEIRDHIRIAELQGPFEENPNVIARPEFGALPLELWGASPGTKSLHGGRLVWDAAQRLPFLALPPFPEPIAVCWFSSADVASNDPISGRLLWTAFQQSPAASFRASALRVPGELDTTRFTSRIRLPGGGVLRLRRTILIGRALADLAQAPARERYAQWQRLAAKYGWPPLLNLQKDDETPLLMHRDSPLALECVFKGVRDHTHFLSVEEVAGEPWLVDADGRHHMAEVALPFRRTVHSWSSRGGCDSWQPFP